MSNEIYAVFVGCFSLLVGQIIWNLDLQKRIEKLEELVKP